MRRNKILFAFMMCFALIMQPAFESESFAAPKKAAAGGKAKKKGKKKKAAAASGAKGGADYSFTSFLPFGVGQFAQGKTVVGAVFAASQAGMLFLHLDRKKQIDLSNSDATQTINEVQASGQPADQETLDYLTANENYVKKTQQEANLALFGFLGLYALGVVDAIFDPLNMRTATMTKEEQMKMVEESHKKTKVGFFVLPSGNDGSERTYGFNLMKSIN